MSSDEARPLIGIGAEAVAVNRPNKKDGIVFVVSAMLGIGILAIPQTFVNAGWAGVAVFVICGCISAFSWTLLGKCLTLLRERYPEEFVIRRFNDTYPKIGHRVGGKFGVCATRLFVDWVLFGAAAAFLLLIADDITNLMRSIGGVNFSSCYVLMIVWVVLTLITLLGTPKPKCYCIAAVVAVATIPIGTLFIFAGIVTDAPEHRNSTQHVNVTVASFFTSFGTMLYPFSFPIVQVDMADPSGFPRAAVIGIFVAVIFLYLIVGIPGFLIFGSDMKPNVLSALSAGGISYAINILITLYLLMAFVMITNTITKKVEEFYGIPDRFTWKRMAIRLGYAALILIFALAIPNFNIILALFGGFAVAFTSFVLPPLFYFLLSRQKNPEDAYGPPPEELPNAALIRHGPYRWATLDLSIALKVILFVIMIVGIVGGLSSTYFVIASLVKGESGFNGPCYAV